MDRFSEKEPTKAAEEGFWKGDFAAKILNECDK